MWFFVVRWVIPLGKDDGGCLYKVGVASDDFRDYCAGWPKHFLFCQQQVVMPHWRHAASFEARESFTAGDVVTVELGRAPGVDCVLSEKSDSSEWGESVGVIMGFVRVAAVPSLTSFAPHASTCGLEE